MWLQLQLFLFYKFKRGMQLSADEVGVATIKDRFTSQQKAASLLSLTHLFIVVM